MPANAGIRELRRAVGAWAGPVDLRK